MAPVDETLQGTYSRIVSEQIERGDEHGLLEAYQLGSAVLQGEQFLEQLIDAHHSVLEACVRESGDTQLAIGAISAMKRVLSEVVAPLEGEVKRLRHYQLEQRGLNERLRKQAIVLDETNAALRDAKREAEALATAKARFLSNMSHEIRTPLNAILGINSLLLETALDETQRDFADTMQTSGDHLLAIINDILDLSKLESGAFELEVAPFKLRQCVEDSLNLIAIKAGSQGLDLLYELEEGVPEIVESDLSRVRQALLNLLSNAVKFTASGHVLLSVTASRNSDGRFEVCFAVKDTGMGIAPDRLQRLFKPFVQVDTSTTRVFGGTGLGLAITHRLTERLGGRCWVESGVGLGSTFFFSLVADGSLPSAPAPDFAGKHLLVLDDNATARDIIRRTAENWGTRVTALSSTLDALEQLRKGDRFDAALIDQTLLEAADGELLAAVQRLDTALPIILSTRAGVRRDSSPVPQPAVKAFLTQPIKPAKIHRALSVLWNLAGDPRLSVSAPPPTVESAPKPLRILLAEDNRVNQKVALALLKRAGYSAVVANNGVETLSAVERDQYDVILMDMQMPELDGLDATRRIIERWPSGQRPRIVMLTASAMSEDRRACFEAGADDYLTKPVTIQKLIEALARCEPLSFERTTESAVFYPVRDSEPIAAAPAPSSSDPLQILLHAVRLTRPNADGDLRAWIAVSTETLRALRRAADCADFATCYASAQRLRSVCEAIGFASEFQALDKLEHMNADQFARDGVEIIADLQRRHRRVVQAIVTDTPPDDPDRP